MLDLNYGAAPEVGSGVMIDKAQIEHNASAFGRIATKTPMARAR
jgi:hypothetical protein